jgi:glycosyltransferase involved in cell wall biosynthesis
LRILAILAVRNEVDYIGNCIQQFLASDIDVTVIDNGSTDGTMEVVSGLLSDRHSLVYRQPYRGFFSLQEQLEIKQSIADASDADWILHVDADEVLQSSREGESLRAAIERVDTAGSTCINFEEFVFLPVGAEYDSRCGPIQPYGTYYFFAPYPLRLMRAWRRSARLSNIAFGGHLLEGDDVHCHSESFVLRHYIVKNQQHAFSKYRDRSYSVDEVKRGWHCNRVDIMPERLVFPSTGLNTLDDPCALNFDRSAPAKKHYWEW